MFKNRKNIELKTIKAEIDNWKTEYQIDFEKTFNRIREQDQKFTYSLLEEKGTLEKECAKEVGRREETEKRLGIILEKNSEIVKEYDQMIEKLNQEIGIQKGKYELASKSKGSLQKKIDNLTSKVKAQEVYIMYLVKELEKTKRKVPSLNKILAYEYKRKIHKINETKEGKQICQTQNKVKDKNTWKKKEEVIGNI